MTFKTIRQQDHSGLSRTNTFELHLSPAPPMESLPAVWLDLHVADAAFQVCGDDIPRPLKNIRGQRAIRIKPYQSVRIRTHERVGVNERHTAVVSNVRSLAIRGLVLAAGKIDPGFSPNPLVLVIHNQTPRPQVINVGEKVAAIAFATLNEPAGYCDAGPAMSEDKLAYAPSILERGRSWFSDQISPNIGKTLLRVVAQVIGVVLMVTLSLWLFGYVPMRHP